MVMGLLPEVVIVAVDVVLVARLVAVVLVGRLVGGVGVVASAFLLEVGVGVLGLAMEA